MMFAVERVSDLRFRLKHSTCKTYSNLTQSGGGLFKKSSVVHRLRKPAAVQRAENQR